MDKLLVLRLTVIMMISILVASCGGSQDDTAGQSNSESGTAMSAGGMGPGSMNDMQGMDMSGMGGMSQADVSVTDEVGQARMSEQGLFQVTAGPQQGPVPLNTMHSWVVHVEAASGQSIDDAEITVAGGMPAHMHGMPTAPAVTRTLGNGDYLVEGMQFQMPGHWKVDIEIDAAGQTDRISLNFNLQP